MRKLIFAIPLSFAVAGALAGAPQADSDESCYAGTRVDVPKPTSVKVAYADASTFFPTGFRDALVQAARNWPQLGDRILLLRFGVADSSYMPEVIFDRVLAPVIADRGWLSHAKEQQIDRCLARQLGRVREDFSAALNRTLSDYRADRNGYSPIAAALAEANSLIATVPRGRVSVLVLSDGVEHVHPRGVSFYQPGGGQQLRVLSPDGEASSLKQLGLLPRLPGVKMWMSGVGLPEPGADGRLAYRRPAADIALLKLTWAKILAESGATVMEINIATPLTLE